MKTLASCKPSEFLAQTYKIKQSVQDWLDVTEILKIRKNKPAIISLDGLTDEEKFEAQVKNKKMIQEQMKKNFNEIFDKVLYENADKTLEVLALCCFVNPEEVDTHPMSEYLEAIGELMSDQGVISFFSSLVQLGQKNTDIVPKR